MFTKEHYIAVAKVIRKGRTFIIQNFMELFEKDSKKFDRKKFLDAIYGKEVSK